MKFEYDLLERLERKLDIEYYFRNNLVGHSLLEAINFLGKDRWELVGEIDDKIILKRRYEDYIREHPEIKPLSEIIKVWK